MKNIKMNNVGKMDITSEMEKLWLGDLRNKIASGDDFSTIYRERNTKDLIMEKYHGGSINVGGYIIDRKANSIYKPLSHSCLIKIADGPIKAFVCEGIDGILYLVLLKYKSQNKCELFIQGTKTHPTKIGSIKNWMNIESICIGTNNKNKDMEAIFKYNTGEIKTKSFKHIKHKYVIEKIKKEDRVPSDYTSPAIDLNINTAKDRFDDNAMSELYPDKIKAEDTEKK